MPIRPKALNSLATIKRNSGVKNSSGEVSKVLTTIASNVPCRIGMNRQVGESDATQHTLISSATHLMFFNVGVNILKGDIVSITGDAIEYRIVFVDKKPGGRTDHHYQVYVKSSDAFSSA